MSDNPLRRLESFGQSIWMDFIRRGTIESGELKKWIDEDGVSGVTSNPSIFEKAIGGSHDYDNSIRSMTLLGKKIDEIYQNLTVEDIQRAADLFRPTYDRLEGKDGFVSLEVSPKLTHDTQGTVDEAHRLWSAVNRPNIMIKVPGTKEGIPAIRKLIADGVNVNITLLFGLPRYRDVIGAYLAGLEARISQGLPVDRIASVASFFLSRIDVLLDPVFEKMMSGEGDLAENARMAHGQVAIASAKIAYQIYKENFKGERFDRLQAKGARVQRLLWASTSTKNPAYSDVKYVDALIGPQTINTLPLETLNAYRDHGNPALRLEDDLRQVHAVMDSLPKLGIQIDHVTLQLEIEGEEKFNKSFDDLMKTIQEKQVAALNEPVDRMVLEMGEYDQKVQQRLEKLEKTAFTKRLWEKDPSLWRGGEEKREEIRNGLGWLHVAEKMDENIRSLESFARETKEMGFQYTVDLGMGGSSLAPMVFERVFSPGTGGTSLIVVDTTNPDAIHNLTDQLPLEKTLFIVASKSGTTAEPLAFEEYFYSRVKNARREKTGENFVAITDPDTRLVKLAQEHGYRQVFLNFPDIGGRYSALSYFGLVPAEMMGLDVGELLARALRMEHACASCVPVKENPGLVLGAVLGELASSGRNKLTLFLPDEITSLGMWLEQLLAESTGKDGTGILPIAGEPIGDPSVYGNDRIFVSFSLQGTRDESIDRAVEKLQKAGQPVVKIQLKDKMDIAQEFYRWEIATAVAGAILGINPFDQPNVQESKDNTNRLLSEIDQHGHLPTIQPSGKEGSILLFGQERANSFSEAFKRFLGTGKPGDYIAILAYLAETRANDRVLERLRVHLRDKTRLPVTVGYGPRYLHSTGQFHKGGPNTGLFIILTSDPEMDAKIPGRSYSFAEFQCAQALGDMEALQKHGRRVIRMDLGHDVTQSLAALVGWVE